MAVIEIAKIIVRRGQELQTGVPQLDAGEFGWAQDTEHLYIGKRIAEGATTDQNTRILTENDLNNFMSVVLNTSTAYSKYQYREFDAHINATTSTVATQLDTWVNLTSYGLIPSTNTNIDITLSLQTAVADLFYNSAADSWQRRDARKELRIPAGSYLITQAVDLPPYTTIVGDGAGITKILFNNSEQSLFRTVDATGVRYDIDPDGMSSGVNQAGHITLRGITFEFANTLSHAQSLVTLDNADTALIEQCSFGVVDATLPAQLGVGIDLRGRGASGAELCRNIVVRDCSFYGVQMGVHGLGTVLGPVVTNCHFENLDYGIAMEYVGTDPSFQPRNGVFTQNTFRNITREGIFSGNFSTRASTTYVTNHLSADNQFYHVGNGQGLSDSYPTTATYAVVTFLSQGNKVSDNHFNRMIYAEGSPAVNWYYNSLVQGNALVSNSAVYAKEFATTSTVNLLKIPLSGSDQMVTMNYQLFNDSFSRKGSVLINVTPTGDSTLSDSYIFSDSLTTADSGLGAINGTTSSTLLISAALSSIYNKIVNEPGVWYIASDSELSTVAYVESVYQSVDGIAISIEPFNPPFTFTYPGNYTLLKTNNPSSDFYYNNVFNKNYVSLTLTPSTSTQYRLEYQLDIQI
jgi:hypothetical protein